MVEIGLMQLVDAVRDGDPIAKLVLDPSGNAETFFKYKGCLCMAYLPGETTRETLFRRTKHSVKSGDTLVYSLGGGRDLDIGRFFDPQVLPQEILNRDLLTTEVLAPFKEENERFCVCSREFHFVVLLNTLEVPEWAQALVNQGKLKVIRVV